jgi:hypothetical protein
MQIKTLEKETVHFESIEADYSLVQGLIHSNKYIHLNDPINELAKYLQVTKEELVRNIEVRQKGGGHLPIINVSVFKNIKLDVQFMQINEVGKQRRPIIDVLNETKSGWSYKTKNGACLALFIHCISNLHLRHKDHWSIDYLKHAKELLLLMPTTAEKDASAVVAVVYRNSADNRIRFCQISNRCVVQPPMVIAIDYNRFFEKRQEKLLS